MAAMLTLGAGETCHLHTLSFTTPKANMEPEHHTFGREEHFHTFSRSLSKHESLNTSEICQFHRGPKNQASCKLPQPYLTGDSLGPVILKPTFLKTPPSHS